MSYPDYFTEVFTLQRAFGGAKLLTTLIHDGVQIRHTLRDDAIVYMKNQCHQQCNILLQN